MGIPKPDISVVMGVYNGAQHLPRTVESILNQQNVDLEFIIINDGSTDHTPTLLQEYAVQDQRLRVYHQDNHGLTRALIQGCNLARGKFIARQDAGDISLSMRLSQQAAWLESHPEVVLVSCGTTFLGPCDEPLYTVSRDFMQLVMSDRMNSSRNLLGPSHHGSTMFRRNTYQQVGGYRDAFYLAQDLDLWVRLAEQGQHTAIPKVFYHARVSPTSITGRYHHEQIRLIHYILASAEARRLGRDETEILRKAALIRPSPNGGLSKLREARTLYFIGACLRQTDRWSARKYFRQAIRAFPFHLRSWYRYLNP